MLENKKARGFAPSLKSLKFWSEVQSPLKLSINHFLKIRLRTSPKKSLNLKIII
jgi:hypothetical protein